jgi:glutamyl-tRNA reductase
VVDLSAPPALATATASQLGARLSSVDDLAAAGATAPSPQLLARLDGLVDATFAEHVEWLDREPRRSAARALAGRAAAAREAELDDLWRRIPDLDAAARSEVERMAERLSDRLLARALERLGGDADGRHGQAARELFGL